MSIPAQGKRRMFLHDGALSSGRTRRRRTVRLVILMWPNKTIVAVAENTKAAMKDGSARRVSVSVSRARRILHSQYGREIYPQVPGGTQPLASGFTVVVGQFCTGDGAAAMEWIETWGWRAREGMRA
jgi:hypothetical protein